MELPEKIYIASEGDYYISEKWDEAPTKNMTNNEYIRTEKFMEWLDGMIENYTKRNGPASMVASLTFKLVKAKIETL